MANAFAALALEMSEDEKVTTAATCADANAPQPAPPADASATEGWLPASAPRRPPAARTPGAQAPSSKLKEPLIFLDLEMTGLDEHAHTILELSLLATDGALKTTMDGPTIAIYHPPDVLSCMNAWSAATHARTGLTARCEASTTSMAQAEEAAIAFVCEVMGWSGGGPPPGGGADDRGDGGEAEEGGGEAGPATAAAAPLTTQPRARRPRLATLAGNSVHVDLAFLRAHMPRLAACCSHRVVDVSGIAELAARWFPAAFHSRPRVQVASSGEGGGAHTAAADVRASLAELKHYRATAFKEDNKEAGRAVAKRYPYGSQEDDASRVALASPTLSPAKPGGGRPDPPGIEASPWFTAAAFLTSLLILALASPFIALAGHRARLAAAPPHLRRLAGPVLADLPQFQGGHASRFLWGTYRPGLYTGVRARVPRSLLAGVMWFDADGVDGSARPPIRHLAEERDGLQTFGWRVHDGESGGVHTAVDGRANVSTSFLKRPVNGVYGGDWVVRISVTEAVADAGADDVPTAPRVSTLFYLADEDAPGTRWAAANAPVAVTTAAGEDGNLRLGSSPLLLATGRSAPVGRWALHAVESGGSHLSIRPARAFTPHFHNLSSLASALLEPPLPEAPGHGSKRRGGDASSSARPAVVELVDGEAGGEGGAERASNTAFFQVTGTAPFSVDFVFTPGLGGDEAVSADEGVPGTPSSPTGWVAKAKAAWRAETGGPGRISGGSQAPGFSSHPSNEDLPSRLAALSGAALTAAFTAQEAAFDARFEAAFGAGVRAGAAGLSAAGVEPTVALSRAALANLLGGLGFFHGRPLVRIPGRTRPSSSHPSAPAAIEGPPSTLFSAVPARAFFPRGFLWDEGFHHLLLGRWSPALSRDALAHWLDLVSTSGWIAREQILGDEARARVPPEFLAQDPAGANPPTLLLPLAAMARRVVAGEGGGAEALADEAAFLAAAFPRVSAWVDWFLSTQAAAGGPADAFAWRGRDAGAGGGRELNPKTLTSGLDDYPRPSHPGPGERHVDVLCWAALAARAAAAVGRAGGGGAKDAAVVRFEAAAARLGAPTHLAALHWDAASSSFADWGMHTDDLALRWHGVRDEGGQVVNRVLLRAPTVGGAPAGDVPADGAGSTTAAEAASSSPAPPSPSFVRHFGYVSLFPVLMRLLPADSPHLGATLARMGDREAGLLSPAGLSSLARASTFRDARNTEHDAPYWRGAAWPPLNYLALSALDHYARLTGPHAETAASLRDEVRAAFVGNVVAQAGAGRGVCDVWERYSGGEDGGGMGPRPFTGWGSLVVLAAAGVYFEI